MLCRRIGLKLTINCKVIPGECVAKQHKPMVCKAKLKGQQCVRWKAENVTNRKRWGEYFKDLLNMENEGMEKSVEPIADAGIELITRDEVGQALSKMKRGKAVGPDGISAEAWKYLEETGVDFLTNLFNDIIQSNKIPEGWRCSILVPIHKGKGDVQNCGNYRGIKLTYHTLKIWERVVEIRQRNGKYWWGTV